MTHKYTIIIKKENSETLVSINGMIDEDFKYDDLLKINDTTVHFNFDGVTTINSCGIREWIEFLNNFPATTNLSYQNCPQVIIEQLSMVKGFIRDNIKVKSFYAPYFCASCDKESQHLLQLTEVQNLKAPQKSCPYCNIANIEFDNIELQYFRFITYLKK
jgi:DNA-directed RNA polymerase subunit RPC12/RpoP